MAEKNKYLDDAGLVQYTAGLAEKFSRYAPKTAVGSPLTAATAAAMTDTDKVYVYTGEETGYTAGNWYYYDGAAWVSGGIYNSAAVETDKSLSEDDVAADAKATGDAVSAAMSLAGGTYGIQEASGSTIRISEAPDNVPLVGLSAGINFTQEGSGTPNPVNNVRNITGVSGITITHFGEDAEDRPETITCTFPSPDGTVYMGSVDILSGTLTLTHRAIIFDGTENWQRMQYSSSTRYRMYLNVGTLMPDSVAPSNVGKNSEGWCSHYDVQTNVNTGDFNKTANIYALTYNNKDFSSNRQINIRHNNVSTEEFKAFLAAEYAAEHPVTLVYKLNEAVTYNLGSRKILLYGGENTIASDGPVLDAAYYTDRNIEEAAYGAYSHQTATGKNLKVYDARENLPLLKLTEGIQLTQSGSGTPTPTNIRPITGVSALTLTHYNAETEENPEVIEYTLPGSAAPVYCGELDILTGILTITHKKVTYDGTESWTKVEGQDVYYTSSPADSVADSQRGTNSTGWSSHYKVYSDIEGFRKIKYGIAYNNRHLTATAKRLYLMHRGISTKDDFLQYLADQYSGGTPVELVYVLDTPLTYRLDSAQMKTLPGVNTFAGSAGAVTATYYAMPHNQPWVTPQLYGAVADGVNDDTAAFQAALSSGRDVYVPTAMNEKYRITSTLNLGRSGQRVYGDGYYRGGSVNTGGCIVFDMSSYTTEDELKTVPLFRTNDRQMTHFYGLRFNAVYTGPLENSDDNYGVLIDAATTVSGDEIVDNTLADKDVEVIGCSANNFYLAFNIRGRGFGLNDSSVASGTFVAKFNWDDEDETNQNNLPCYGQRAITFRNNRLHSNSATIYVESGHAYGLTFVNNTMDHGRGYVLIAEDEAWNWVISGNTFDSLYNQAAYDAPFWFKSGAKCCSITGNVFACEGNYWQSTIQRFPVRTYIKSDAAFTGCAVTGNVFRISQESLLTFTTIPQTTISGNVFSEPGYEVGYKPDEPGYPSAETPTFPKAGAISLSGVSERATIVGNTFIAPQAGSPLETNPNAKFIVISDGTKLNNSTVEGNSCGESDSGLKNLRWSDGLFTDEITKELTEKLDSVEVTPDLDISSSGISASAGESGELVIYGTLSSNRRLSCLNGQHTLGTTTTTFSKTLDAGIYEIKTGASGYKTIYSWRYKFTTSGSESTFANSDIPDRIVHFEKPAMLFLFMTSGLRYGTEDNPSRFTISIKRLSSIDVWARQEIEKLKSAVSSLQS